MAAEYMLSIAVCDDASTDCTCIANMTEQILRSKNVMHRIAEFKSAQELLEAIQNGTQFQILVLDVMMDEMDGMELAALLRQQKNQAAIIFISNNREMAMQGYEVNASRYLAKPVNSEKLQEALFHCCSSQYEKREILLPTGQGQHRTYVSDIQFVEAFDRGTRFVFVDESVETKLKFSEVGAMLPENSFVLCHRAFIANLSFVKRIRHYEFEMKSGVLVPISKHRYSEINKKFLAYITN